VVTDCLVSIHDRTDIRLQQVNTGMTVVSMPGRSKQQVRVVFL